MIRPALMAWAVGFGCIAAGPAAASEDGPAVSSIAGLNHDWDRGGQAGSARSVMSDEEGKAGSVTFGRALGIEGNPVRLINRSRSVTLSGKGFVSSYNGPFSKPAGMPVRATRISSNFGSRRHPVLGGVRFHQGLDFPAAMGAPVFATAPGQIATANWCGGLGYCIVIDHGQGYATVFGHLLTISVEPGQVVQRGQKLGAVGSTGISTGPHLHFEVRLNGLSLDPRPFL